MKSLYRWAIIYKYELVEVKSKGTSGETTKQRDRHYRNKTIRNKSAAQEIVHSINTFSRKEKISKAKELIKEKV